MHSNGRDNVPGVSGRGKQQLTIRQNFAGGTDSQTGQPDIMMIITLLVNIS